MRRRAFIKVIVGSAATWPFVARAQQPQRVRRIGLLMGQAESNPESSPRAVAFRQALNRLGWTEGRNLRIDYRTSAGETNRMHADAKQLIGLAPDVVVAESTPATAALRAEASTTPIVFLSAANPVGSGFVASLAHPGGNITGFTNFEPSMGSKWLEVLKGIAPRVARVAAIFNPQTHTGQYWPVLATAALSFAVEFIKAPAHDAAEIELAVETLARAPNGGLLVMPDAFTNTHRGLIIALAARHRLPAIYAFRFFVTDGGLISYGNDVVDDYRRAAGYVDRILRGEKPGDLPVQAPTKFELVINLKTAKALGLDVPLHLQQLADELIE